MKTIEQYIDSEMSGKIAQKRNSPFLALLVLAVGIVHSHWFIGSKPYSFDEIKNYAN